MPKIVHTVRYCEPPNRYPFHLFLLDIVLTLMTGGWWLIWPAFKFLRTHHR